jgi:hypothetical protein
MPNILMTRRALAAVTIALSLAATAAFAQQPGRIRGQIEKVDGPMLALKTRDGTMMNVKVDEKARVAALVKATLADIKTDSFIGVAGMPQPDGSIEAFSVHIFLPAQRGVVPDRHGPWDARPGSTMTNAYVESMVAAKDGETLMVKFKDGEKKIVVTPQTAITAVAPGKMDELKAGTNIIIMASEKQADGSMLAKVLYVGRNVVPAM